MPRIRYELNAISQSGGRQLTRKSLRHTDGSPSRRIVLRALNVLSAHNTVTKGNARDRQPGTPSRPELHSALSAC